MQGGGLWRTIEPERRLAFIIVDGGRRKIVMDSVGYFDGDDAAAVLVDVAAVR